MNRLFLILLILISSNCYGSDGIIIKQGDSFCLPGTEFKISGITNNSSIDDVIALKGKPNSIKQWEDSRYKTFIYDDMKIDISIHHVLYLETDSEKNKTTSGIKPSMGLTEVCKILGIKDTASKSEYQFVM